MPYKKGMHLDFNPEQAVVLFRKMSEHLAECLECRQKAREDAIPLRQDHVDPYRVGIDIFQIWGPLARVMSATHPRFLEPHEISSQLAEISAGSIIIDCWRVGDHPGMDLIDGQNRQHFDGRDFDQLASSILAVFQDNADARLIMLCDLYAEENEPQAGVVWTHEYRVKGAIVGVMSCLFMLIRDNALRVLLFEQPERLVIATIENSNIIPQEGEGPRLVTFLHNRRS